ncbi:hypothetical protein JWG45_08690 [Leptospira sp. 201903070]|uniref:Uncharacterized protein n=1 Tax=Leptospira ainlahdjerensis TaxID=2810033 RepID=A0ABS2UA30_9LEPT|nr:hypothetical protein [Leptospira ainlahdjerensis]MBM9577227.1 hypothetical protein [Leptospira ainlahdjerensis]
MNWEHFLSEAKKLYNLSVRLLSFQKERLHFFFLIPGYIKKTFLIRVLRISSSKKGFAVKAKESPVVKFVESDRKTLYTKIRIFDSFHSKMIEG